MKRYMIFLYDHFYPSGGMKDFFGATDSKEIAINKVVEYAKKSMDNFGHVYDIIEKKIIYEDFN